MKNLIDVVQRHPRFAAICSVIITLLLCFTLQMNGAAASYDKIADCVISHKDPYLSLVRDSAYYELYYMHDAADDLDRLMETADVGE